LIVVLRGQKTIRTKSKLQHFIPLSFMLNPIMVSVWGKNQETLGFWFKPNTIYFSKMGMRTNT